jgi:transposase
MMGTKERAFQRHAAVSLESLVPADHFYRHLETKLDLSFARDLVAERYSSIGRPSIDPVVFFKLQLCMFFEGIRSERQLMRVVADRLSLRWYIGYDLCETVPDHSSLTKIRERYGLEVFRRFFDEIVERCVEAGLVWGEEIYFDATKVEANASVDSVKPRFAVEAHLAELFAEGGTQAAGAPEPEPLPVDLPEDALRGLAETNARRHDWIAEEGRQDRDGMRGDYRRVADFKASTTDPDATLMPLKRGVHMGYHVHYAVDGGKARIILQALVTPSEVMENTPMLDLLWRSRFRWKLRPRQATGDTTYGTIDNIRAVEDAGIRAYVPLADWGRTPYYGPSHFTYDPAEDAYRCPRGQPLRRYTAKYTEEVWVYRALPDTCNACPVKPECTASHLGRTVHRSFHAEYLERVRSYHETEGYRKAMRKRRVWVEPLFGEGKQWHGLTRFRLRRLRRVNTETLLIATGQNLKRLLSWRGWGKRHFPGGAAGVRVSLTPAQTKPI